jgi:hypothetical protein
MNIKNAHESGIESSENQIEKAKIEIKRIFSNGENIKEMKGGDIIIKKIDDKTFEINYYGSVRYALPIFVVREVITEQKGDPGVVNVEEGWAYPDRGDKDIKSYKDNIKELTKDDAEFSGGWIDSPDVGSRLNWNWSGTMSICITEDEAMSEIAESTKKLDVPSIESMHGKITPREYSLLGTASMRPWEQDNVDDMFDDAGLLNLEDAISNLPHSQEEYKAHVSDINGPHEESDRLAKIIAKSILERKEVRY